jgi:hypothetical protein
MSFFAKAIEFADSVFESIPFARIVYSLVLTALIILIGRELLSVWDRGKYFLTDFSYFDGGAKKTDYGEQLRNETILDYGMILDLIKRYPPKVDPGADDSSESDDCQPKGWWKQLTSDTAAKFQEWATEAKRSAARLLATITGKSVEPDDSNNSDSSNEICRQKTIVSANVDQILQNLQTEKLDKVVGQLDVTVQGINLKSLLSAFGNLVYPKNTEIAASIYAAPNKDRRTVLSISGAPLLRQLGGLTDRVPRVFNIEAGIDDAENAFRIACFLVWAQWDTQKDPASQDATRVAYDELCNWGKILAIKDAMASSTAYYLDQKKKKLDLDFLKAQFAFAAQLDVGMHEIYASLAGLEDFVGKEKVSFSEGSETDIDSLADIIRYLAFTKSASRDKRDRVGDWTKGLPKDGAGPKEVNQNFFQQMILTDSDKKYPGLRAEVIDNAKNIVRISRLVPRRKTIITLITSGFILKDDVVISVAAGPVDPKTLEPFAKAEVSTVSSDGTGQTLTVAKAEYLDPKAGTPFIRLTVPGLKRSGGKPSFDFDGLSEDQGAVIAGYIRDTNLIFASRKELNDSDTSVMNNNVTHLIKGRVAVPYYDDFADDRERRFHLNTPFAAGLTGAPIFSRSGTVNGFVESGAYIGKNLSLGVGLSITTLKQNELLAEFSDQE